MRTRVHPIPNSSTPPARPNAPRSSARSDSAAHHSGSRPGPPGAPSTGRATAGAEGAEGEAQGPGAAGQDNRRHREPGDQRTRPYQTLFVQIFSSFTQEPDLGECQILPLPA